MKKDGEFFNLMEDYNFLVLNEFNNKNNVFDSLSRLEEYSPADASGITNNKKILIETKARTGNTKSFKDFIIESKKVAYLLLKWLTEGFIPLYINFLDIENADMPNKIAIWRLDKLSKWKYIPLSKTWTNGYKKQEVRERFLLSLDDATIYVKEDPWGSYYKIVQDRYVLR